MRFPSILDRVPEARVMNQSESKIESELECATFRGVGGGGNENSNKCRKDAMEKCSEIDENEGRLQRLTAAMISSSTALKPSEPLRDIVPDARRRS